MITQSDSRVADAAFIHGYAKGIVDAANAAEKYYPSIIRCSAKSAEEHVRLHVESKWCAAIAAHIRRLMP